MGRRDGDERVGLLDATDGDPELEFVLTEPRRDRDGDGDGLRSWALASASLPSLTPLNAIIGYSEMTQETLVAQGEEEMAEDTTRVLKASLHLLSLINDVLDVSKIEAGELELHHEKFSLDELMGNVKDTIAPLAAARGLSTTVSKEGDFQTITGDQRRLE